MSAALIWWRRSSVRPRSSFGRRGRAAEVVLLNGKILTVDPHDSVVEAVAIGFDGRFMAIGSNAEIRGWMGANTKIIDLHGRTVTPGLIDSHGHYADGGLNELYTVNLSEAKSIAEIVRQNRRTREDGEARRMDSGHRLGRKQTHRAALCARSRPGQSDAEQSSVAVAYDRALWRGEQRCAETRAHHARDKKSKSGNHRSRRARAIRRACSKKSAMDAVLALIPPATPEQEHDGDFAHHRCAAC